MLLDSSEASSSLLHGSDYAIFRARHDEQKRRAANNTSAASGLDDSRAAPPALSAPRRDQHSSHSGVSATADRELNDSRNHSRPPVTAGASSVASSALDDVFAATGRHLHRLDGLAVLREATLEVEEDVDGVSPIRGGWRRRTKKRQTRSPIAMALELIAPRPEVVRLGLSPRSTQRSPRSALAMIAEESRVPTPSLSLLLSANGSPIRRRTSDDDDEGLVDHDFDASPQRPPRGTVEEGSGTANSPQHPQLNDSPLTIEASVREHKLKLLKARRDEATRALWRKISFGFSEKGIPTQKEIRAHFVKKPLPAVRLSPIRREQASTPSPISTASPGTLLSTTVPRTTQQHHESPARATTPPRLAHNEVAEAMRVARSWFASHAVRVASDDDRARLASHQSGCGRKPPRGREDSIFFPSAVAENSLQQQRSRSPLAGAAVTQAAIWCALLRATRGVSLSRITCVERLALLDSVLSALPPNESGGCPPSIALLDAGVAPASLPSSSQHRWGIYTTTAAHRQNAYDTTTNSPKKQRGSTSPSRHSKPTAGSPMKGNEHDKEVFICLVEPPNDGRRRPSATSDKSAFKGDAQQQLLAHERDRMAVFAAARHVKFTEEVIETERTVRNAIASREWLERTTRFGHVKHPRGARPMNQRAQSDLIDGATVSSPPPSPGATPSDASLAQPAASACWAQSWAATPAAGTTHGIIPPPPAEGRTSYARRFVNAAAATRGARRLLAIEAAARLDVFASYVSETAKLSIRFGVPIATRAVTVAQLHWELNRARTLRAAMVSWQRRSEELALMRVAHAAWWQASYSLLQDGFAKWRTAAWAGQVTRECLLESRRVEDAASSTNAAAPTAALESSTTMAATTNQSSTQKTDAAASTSVIGVLTETLIQQLCEVLEPVPFSRDGSTGAASGAPSAASGGAIDGGRGGLSLHLMGPSGERLILPRRLTIAAFGASAVVAVRLLEWMMSRVVLPEGTHIASFSDKDNQCQWQVALVAPSGDFSPRGGEAFAPSAPATALVGVKRTILSIDPKATTNPSTSPNYDVLKLYALHEDPSPQSLPPSSASSPDLKGTSAAAEPEVNGRTPHSNSTTECLRLLAAAGTPATLPQAMEARLPFTPWLRLLDASRESSPEYGVLRAAADEVQRSGWSHETGSFSATLSPAVDRLFVALSKETQPLATAATAPSRGSAAGPSTVAAAAPSTTRFIVRSTSIMKQLAHLDGGTHFAFAVLRLFACVERAIAERGAVGLDLAGFRAWAADEFWTPAGPTTLCQLFFASHFRWVSDRKSFALLSDSMSAGPSAHAYLYDSDVQRGGGVACCTAHLQLRRVKGTAEEVSGASLAAAASLLRAHSLKHRAPLIVEPETGALAHLFVRTCFSYCCFADRGTLIEGRSIAVDIVTHDCVVSLFEMAGWPRADLSPEDVIHDAWCDMERLAEHETANAKMGHHHHLREKPQPSGSERLVTWSGGATLRGFGVVLANIVRRIGEESMWCIVNDWGFDAHLRLHVVSVPSHSRPSTPAAGGTTTTSSGVTFGLRLLHGAAANERSDSGCRCAAFAQAWSDAIRADEKSFRTRVESLIEDRQRQKVQMARAKSELRLRALSPIAAGTTSGSQLRRDTVKQQDAPQQAPSQQPPPISSSPPPRITAQHQQPQLQQQRSRQHFHEEFGAMETEATAAGSVSGGGGGGQPHLSQRHHPGGSSPREQLRKKQRSMKHRLISDVDVYAAPLIGGGISPVPNLESRQRSPQRAAAQDNQGQRRYRRKPSSSPSSRQRAKLLRHMESSRNMYTVNGTIRLGPRPVPSV